jgi:uncharacterized membrane protein YqgA involved in biofilm formation
LLVIAQLLGITNLVARVQAVVDIAASLDIVVSVALGTIFGVVLDYLAVYRPQKDASERARASE